MTSELHEAAAAGFSVAAGAYVTGRPDYPREAGQWLREVLELGPGDVVELDRHVSEPVDLVVGDRIVARGEVVVVNGNFALRITEVATPQLRLESIRCLF